MDADPNTLAIFDPSFTPITPTGGRPPRKRARTSDNTPESEFAKLQDKREKARERQRRKRERDRRRDSGVPGIPQPVLPPQFATFPAHTAPPPPPPPVQQIPHPIPQQQQQQQQPHQQPQQPQTPGQASNGTASAGNLTPDELARREKVRAAARERQRKHRALVKQKRMAELGLALGADGMPGMEEIHYTLGPDGQYQPVLTTHPAHPHGHPTELGDQPFPQGHTGGQTFASTLLLSFSCSPLLKQHLLRTLHMTNEELASLEPILSAAWDQWDHARRIHYAEQAAKAEQNGVGQGSSNAPPHPFVAAPIDATNAQPQAPSSNTNDFRARFHRPLTAPSPFRIASGPGTGPPIMGSATAAEAVSVAVGAAVASALGAHQQSQQIDPMLTASGPTENGVASQAQTGPITTATTATEGENEDGTGSEADADGDIGDDKDETDTKTTGRR